MSTLLLLRHGQAAFGADHYDQLSPLGLRQAEATGRFIASRGWTFDQVLSGPRQRQLATAAGVLSQLDHTPALQTVDALDEFADGSQVLDVARQLGTAASASGPERLRQYIGAIRAWADGRLDMPGTRTAERFCDDTHAWLKALMADSGPGQRVLAVTSAGTIGAFVCAVLGLPAPRLADFLSEIHNAAFTEIVYTRDRCSLRVFNGSAHLPSDLLTLM